MSKSTSSAQVHHERRDFIAGDEEEVRGLVRGQIVTSSQQQQGRNHHRRRALENLEESENLFQEHQQSHHHNHRGEDEQESSGERELQRLNSNFHNQDRRHQASSSNNMSLALPDRHPAHTQSTASLLDSMERRTQRTYRYGIGLVCVGATLNWLGFAQGHGYVDPLRYLGVACVISGSFCVCLAMCRWLGRPISVSSHRVAGLGRIDYQDGRDGTRQGGDVHVINVAVPMYVPPMGEEYRPTKPPDYDAAVDGEPPPYDEAIKLSPGALFSATATSNSTSKNGDDGFFDCGQASPSRSMNLTVPEGLTIVSPCRDSSTASITMPSNLIAEIHRSGFHPDSVVVVVDASESANNANNLTSKLGAPPPYTREYTPSPRRTVVTTGRRGDSPSPHFNSVYCSTTHDNSEQTNNNINNNSAPSPAPMATNVTESIGSYASDNSNFVNNNNSNSAVIAPSTNIDNGSDLSPNVSSTDHRTSVASNSNVNSYRSTEA